MGIVEDTASYEKAMCENGKNHENVRTIYKELCTSYRAIDDFRTKLLGFLPLATGGIFAFLIDPKFFADPKSEAATRQLLPVVGGLGTVVTLGLYAFEIYGIRKCTSLIYTGKRLEYDLGMEHGQFIDRPNGVLRVINEPLASGIIYPTVLAAWTYIARYGTVRQTALCWSIDVFLIFFMLSLLFIAWLTISEVPKLEKELKLPPSKPQEG